MFGGRIPNIAGTPLFINTENADILFKGEYIIKTLNPEKTYILTDNFKIEEAEHNDRIGDDLLFDEVYIDDDIKITDNIKIIIDLEDYQPSEIENYINSILDKLPEETSNKWFNDVIKKNFPFVISKQSGSYRYIGLSAKPNLLNKYTFIYKFTELLRILYNDKYNELDIKKIYTVKEQKQLLVDLEKDIMELFEDETHRFVPADPTMFKNEKEWVHRFETKETETNKYDSNKVLMQRYVNFCDMISVLATYTDDIKNNLDKSLYDTNIAMAYKSYIDNKYLNAIENDKDYQTYNVYLLRDIREILLYRTKIIHVLDKESAYEDELPSIRLFMMYLYERLNKKYLSLDDRGGNILPISFKNSIKLLGVDITKYLNTKMYPYWTVYAYMYNGVSFSGCCETGIIEFIKALCYDPNKTRFDPSLLPKSTDPKLKAFMQKYKPNEYGSYPGYNSKLMKDLLDVFENRNDISYKKDATINGKEFHYEFYSLNFFKILSALFGTKVDKSTIHNINKNPFIQEIVVVSNNISIKFINNLSLEIVILQGHTAVSVKDLSGPLNLKKTIKRRFINGNFRPKTKAELKLGIANRNQIPIDIEKWDVSRITDMSELFDGNNMFNKDISSWNVSNVTNMEHMFRTCHYFNKPLNVWNVSNVTNMLGMFEHCHNFNQPLNDWNVSNVTKMYNMFYACHNFNQPLNDWNVSNVTDMGFMFYLCKFNQPLYWENLNIDIINDHDMFINMFQDNYEHYDKGIGLLATPNNVENYKKSINVYLSNKSHSKERHSRSNKLKRKTSRYVNKKYTTRTTRKSI